MYRRPLFFAALLMTLSACVDAPDGHRTDGHPLDEMRAAFIAHTTADVEAYEVCEYYDKTQDPRAFLARALGEQFVAHAETTAVREIRVRAEEGDSGTLHLGIVALGFRDVQTAKRIYELAGQKDAPYFENALILTKYVPVREGKVVLILYSETFVDDRVRRFFDQAIGEEGIPQESPEA